MPFENEKLDFCWIFPKGVGPQMEKYRDKNSNLRLNFNPRRFLPYFAKIEISTLFVDGVNICDCEQESSVLFKYRRRKENLVEKHFVLEEREIA